MESVPNIDRENKIRIRVKMLYQSEIVLDDIPIKTKIHSIKKKITDRYKLKE